MNDFNVNQKIDIFISKHKIVCNLFNLNQCNRGNYHFRHHTDLVHIHRKKDNEIIHAFEILRIPHKELIKTSNEFTLQIK